MTREVAAGPVEAADPDAESVEIPATEWNGLGPRELALRWGAAAVHAYRRVGSTSARARSLAAAGAEAGTLVLAEEQTAGKGRVGRGWHSPPGLGLWFSFVARPPSLREPGALPLTVALTVAGSLEGLVGNEVVAIKWPNDLVAGGRKLGGILCEAVWEPDSRVTVLVGVGINIRHREHDFPREIADRATSLELASGRPVGRLEVADAVIPALLARLSAPVSLGARELERFSARDVLRGREVIVSDPTSGRVTAEGVAAGISPDGCLLLRAADETLKIHTGTVRFAGDAG